MKKIPQAEKGPEMDQSKAPNTKGQKHIEKTEIFRKPDEECASKAPCTEKKQLPLEDAPTGVKGVNGGESMSLPKSGGVGESEV